MSLLQTEKLHVSIGGRNVCNRLDMQVEPGQVWGILGRNGSGKTTLLHTLAGLRSPDSGKIQLDSHDIEQLGRKQLAQKIGILLQHHEDAFPASVIDTVLSGRHPHIGYWQWESSRDHEIAKQALQTVGMSDLADRQINLLSGGERQRVAIAGILTQDPDILLLDEPNSHLDLKHQIGLLQHVSRYARGNQRSMIMSLHDINLAARFCSHILFLYGDGNTEQGPAEQLLTAERLERLYDHPIKSTHSDNTIQFWPG